MGGRIIYVFTMGVSSSVHISWFSVNMLKGVVRELLFCWKDEWEKKEIILVWKCLAITTSAKHWRILLRSHRLTSMILHADSLGKKECARKHTHFLTLTLIPPDPASWRLSTSNTQGLHIFSTAFSFHLLKMYKYIKMFRYIILKFKRNTH